MTRMRDLRSRLPQHAAFFDVRYRQPARAFGFQRVRDRHRAVTIGVGLHHRHHFDGVAHQGPHRAKIGANLPQRNFYPAPHVTVQPRASPFSSFSYASVTASQL